MKLKTIELFGGIGACSKALERLGIDYEIADYVEIDKYAVKSYNAIHGTNFEPQDITQWDKDIEVDLIMHGSPCQDFSLAGKQAGGDEGSGTRSSLLYETIRIVSKLKPKYVIWENVKNVLSKKHRHNFDNYLSEMEKLGYTNYYQVLNAKDYGIPQNRERVFTISILGEQEFAFPTKKELKLKLKDMLEDEVDEKYYLSNEKLKTLIPFGSYYTRKDNQGNINTQCNRACNENGNSLTIPTIAGLTKVLIKESIQTITTSGGSDRGVVIGTYQYAKSDNFMHGKDRLQLGKETSDTIQTTPKEGVAYSNLRIRKLTPKEVWRLMGFDDVDFDKAALVNSNAQLYKQAGNSIVVNVLEAILTNLLK